MRECTLQEAFLYDFLSIVLPLLVTAILFYFAGYFLGKNKKNKVKKEDNEWENKHKKLEQKYHELFIQSSGGKIDLDNQSSMPKETIQSEAFVEQEKSTPKSTQNIVEQAIDTDEFQVHFGNQVSKDDLKLIEGIGPKIALLLNEKGINTWKELSEISVEIIRNWLFEAGGAAYKIHEPSTWPKQALLAHEGKFKELKDFQDLVKKSK